MGGPERHPLRNRRGWRGFGAQLAGSESPSKSSIVGGFWGPASWVGIPFEIVDLLGGGSGPASWVGIPSEIVDGPRKRFELGFFKNITLLA